MWKKDVDSNLMKYKNIFDTMQGVMNIYSFGFSYSEVDLPYIQAIVARIKSSSEVCWYFNSYDRGSMSIWENNIKKLGYKGRFDCFDVCV